MKTHETCPHCGHKDCYTYYEDHEHCYSCGHQVWYKKKEVDMEADLKPLRITYRGITPETADYFRVVTLGTADDTVSMRLYPYPHATKKRIHPKDFSQNKGFSNEHMFGMDKVPSSGGNEIYVVEGEEDTMATHQMLKPAWVVGVPGAKPPQKLWENSYAKLSKFDKIVVIPDNDEAGSSLVSKLATQYPNKVYEVTLDRKDPNEYVEANDVASFIHAVSNKRKAVAKWLYNSPAVFKNILAEEERLVYYPHPSSATE